MHRKEEKSVDFMRNEQALPYGLSLAAYMFCCICKRAFMTELEIELFDELIFIKEK